MKEKKRKEKGEWELLIEVLSGEKCSDDPVFVEWLESQENRALYDYLRLESKGRDEWDKEYLFEKISTSLGLRYPNKKIQLRKIAAIAASFAIVVASSVFIWYLNINTPQELSDIVEKESVVEEGNQRIRLTLDEGKTIDLSSGFSETKSGNTLLTNDTSGTLRYVKEDTILPPKTHLLEIPYGNEYKLILSDGTKVYLNSGTKIKYPNYFADNQRVIELEGEAYFDVEKSDKPFVVRTENIDVMVLGTVFNVKAYKDERYVNTTLVEGKVQVNTKYNKKEYVMTPNHNLSFDSQTNQVLNERVNTDLYTAWIRGQFVFRNQKLENITQQLSRWYDVDISYENNKLRELRFTGSVDKSRDVDNVLKKIEIITNLKYKRNEGQIVIYN